MVNRPNATPVLFRKRFSNKKQGDELGEKGAAD